jgi:uncharacterized membrane protein YgcG
VAQVAAGDETAVEASVQVPHDHNQAPARRVSQPGAGLAPRVQDRVEDALQVLRRDNGLDVSVLVGDLDLTDIGGFRAGAEVLHAALGARAEHAVLLVVAPGQRKLEIVTGPGVRRRVPDRVCALAALSMTTAFASGDLGGGIVDALRQIGSAAGPGTALPRIDEPDTALANAPALHQEHAHH